MNVRWVLLFKLAWRNLWRNRRRTLLSSSVIVLGYASMVLTDGFIKGMVNNLVHNITSSYMGHAQVHHGKFLAEMDSRYYISQPESLLSQLRAQPEVWAISPRVVFQGILSSPAGARPVLFLGVDSALEAPLSKFDEAMISGEYLDSPGGRSILVGHSLLQDLEVELGDRLVASGVGAHSHNMVQELLHLRGVFEFRMPEIDRNMVVIPIETAQKMLGLGGGVHEVAIQFGKVGRQGELPPIAGQIQLSSEQKYSDYLQLAPSIAAVMDSMSLSTAIMGSVLFFIVGLGIMNNMLMALYERFFEFGVLKAVGSTPFQVSLLIWMESVCLGLFSLLVGLPFSFLLIWWLGSVGIDYSGIDFAGVTMAERIYPEMNLQQFVVLPVWVFLWVTVAGLYPIWVVWKTRPFEMMRRGV